MIIAFSLATAAEHLHVGNNDFGDVAIFAVLFILLGCQFALDVDEIAFLQILANDFSKTAIEHEVMVG